jgi:hypothetical protein
MRSFAVRRLNIAVRLDGRDVFRSSLKTITRKVDSPLAGNSVGFIDADDYASSRKPTSRHNMFLVIWSVLAVA